jgi:hypothetical protein
MIYYYFLKETLIHKKIIFAIYRYLENKSGDTYGSWCGLSAMFLGVGGTVQPAMFLGAGKGSTHNVSGSG